MNKQYVFAEIAIKNFDVYRLNDYQTVFTVHEH